MKLRIGVWNIDRGKPARRQAQVAHIAAQAADLWLLTEVPSDLRVPGLEPALSASRPAEAEQCWSAVAVANMPFRQVMAVHPALAMAIVEHPDGEFLAAASVFPWRSSGEFWPAEDGDTFADRCATTLTAHEAAIHGARAGRAVVWGGDFNQALSGRDHVGSDIGRHELLAAFGRLGLRAVTAAEESQFSGQLAIDHMAIPANWAGGLVDVQRPMEGARALSDHPAYLVDVATE
jgi:hypothetical protein